MTTQDKATRRKLSLLELASELDNVAKACRIMGYSRQQFLRNSKKLSSVWCRRSHRSSARS